MTISQRPAQPRPIASTFALAPTRIWAAVIPSIAIALGACGSGHPEPVASSASALSSYAPNGSCPASATTYCNEARTSLGPFLGGTTGQIDNGESIQRSAGGGDFEGGAITWHDANTVEMLVDYYVATGDTTYNDIVAAYKSFDAINHWGAGNSFPLGVNTYNDDRLWWALTFIRAYDEMPDHDTTYLNNAISIFQSVCSQWNSSPGCGGGVPQQVGGAGGSTIANELFFATAAKLATRAPSAANVCSGGLPWTSSPVSTPFNPAAPGADGVGGMSYQFQNDYLGWALAEYEWFKKYYLPGVAAVGFTSNMGNELPLQDGLSAPPACTPGGTQWTYNQGPILGALLELSTLPATTLLNGAESDPPSAMQSLAYLIATQAMAKFSNAGILTELDDWTAADAESSTGCFNGAPGDQGNGDCSEFKGIFMRYLWRLTYESWPAPATSFLTFRSDATAFMTQNANAIWRSNETFPVTWAYDTIDVSNSTVYQPSMTSGLDGIISAIPVQGPPPPVGTPCGTNGVYDTAEICVALGSACGSAGDVVVSNGQCMAIGTTCGTNDVYDAAGLCVAVGTACGSSGDVVVSNGQCVAVGTSCGTNDVYDTAGVCAAIGSGCGSAPGYLINASGQCTGVGTSCGANSVMSNVGYCVVIGSGCAVNGDAPGNWNAMGQCALETITCPSGESVAGPPGNQYCYVPSSGSSSGVAGRGSGSGSSGGGFGGGSSGAGCEKCPKPQ